MSLGPRAAGRVVRALLSHRHYAALARMVRDGRPWPPILRAYLTGRLTSPLQVTVRTPTGPVAILLRQPSDVVTLNEIFFRRDYPAPAGVRIVIDLGANIGLAALWYLTRDPNVFCECYEPVPTNITRLHETLAAFAGRYAVHASAVADRAGQFSFAVEPTGRYGSLDRSLGATITVDCIHINQVIASALAMHGRVDLIKIDTEGSEAATIEAIDDELLGQVRHIVAEEPHLIARLLTSFEPTAAAEVVHYARRESAAAS
jgi:FkbM family methyltransferase